MAALRLGSNEDVSEEIRQMVTVANGYLRDDKGADLDISDDAAKRVFDMVMAENSNYAVTNNQLAGMQAASFVELRSNIRTQTLQIKDEVRAIEKAVVACHADTIEKLNLLQDGIATIDQKVVVLSNNLDQVATSLMQFQSDFHRYVMRDELNNNVQIAKQDLIALNQRLESDFGQNKELRRAAIGILQANDLNVRTDTILNIAEELMVTTPNYWLAPALVALANWVDASRAVSEGESSAAQDVRRSITSIEGMLEEAYRRERAKTALFFGLISRRANNIPQANAWFMEYIGFQDPRAVDHTCMVLLNLYAGGLMGHGIEERMILATMDNWFNELMSDADAAYEKTLIQDWEKKFVALRSESVSALGSYRALSAFSPTWNLLVEEMQESSIHFDVQTYLEHALSDKNFSEDDTTLIDSMIADLVTEYEAEELPIRREQEYQKLIVDLGGRKDIAGVLRTLKDDVMTETKSFVSILSDAARNAELSHASAATHALAIRIQMPWIRQAYVMMTEAYRSRFPKRVALKLGEFEAQTDYGRDEDRVVKDYLGFADAQEREALAKSQTGIVQKVCLIAGAICFVLGVILTIANVASPFNIFLAIAGLAAGGYGLFAATRARKAQQRIRQNMAEKRRYGLMIIRTFMEEARQWLSVFMQRDAAFDTVLANMDAMTTSFNDETIIVENSTQI